MINDLLCLSPPAVVFHSHLELWTIQVSVLCLPIRVTLVHDINSSRVAPDNSYISFCKITYRKMRQRDHALADVFL